jgi:hypothetical protein
MASPHVPVARALRLPACFAHVAGYLARQDADLRIRRSVDDRRYFVLERRVRRGSPVQTGARDASDLHIQARDGYLHVARVHPNWLLRPWQIVRALKDEGVDLWARGAAREEDEIRYAAAWAKETARRRRREDLRSRARELFDLADRRGDGAERPRISAPGVPSRQQRRAAQRAAFGRTLGQMATGATRRERRAVARQGGRAS